MGVALGWMALALAAVAGAPDAGRGGVPIKYTVQFMEADGVAWREAVFARLTPVTRQGSATVWTAPHDVANRLVEQAKKSPTARILQAPKVIAWSGATAHIIARTNQELVTQAAWNVDENSVQTKPETVRTGSTTTLMGRKLDQGVLVQMVLQDTQVLAVHRITVAGSKEARSAAAATKAAYHVDECAGDLACCVAGPMMVTARSDQKAVMFTAVEPEYPWSHIPVLTDAGPVAGPTTANVNQKRTTRRGAKQAAKVRKKGIAVVVAAAVPETDCCTSATTSLSCDGASAARKVALEVPEIDSQEIAGEWLIPNDGILLVSFGPHTVADKDGKAVVREQLAIIEAAEAAEPAATYRVNPMSAALSGANPDSSRSSVRGVAVPVLPLPEAMSPTREVVPPAPLVPPSSAEMPMAPMPPVPSRSIPQGYHVDGKAADLPPLPANEADDDSSESAEPRPSPQTRPTPQPEPAPEAKPEPSRPSGDTAAKKAQYSVPGFPNIPAMFQSGPAVGLQFLVPIKPVFLKLPFDRRLELEIYGRVVHNPAPQRSTADLATKPAKDGATTK